jgi:hypothetical protein
MSEEYRPMSMAEFAAKPKREAIEAERQELADDINSKRPLGKKILGFDKVETKDIAQGEADREVIIRDTIDSYIAGMDDETLKEARKKHQDYTTEPIEHQVQLILGSPLTQRERDSIYTLVYHALGIENAKRNKTQYVSTTYRTMTSGPGFGQGLKVPIERVVKDFREDKGEDEVDPK